MVKLVFLALGLLFFAASAPDFPPPPGTIKVAANVYLDKEPITYLAYQEYISYIQRTEADLAMELIPEDTTLTYKNEVLWNNPHYIDFPILGLSEEQMKSYCQWRSKVVNQLIDARKSDKKADSYWTEFVTLDPSNEYSVEYSIPSAEDFEKYKSDISQSDINEYLTDGKMIYKKSDAGDLSDEDVYMFRCIAAYKKVK